ncbi:MAG: hypothetical protein ACR652_21050 [Methylocystis sp.]|uniref:hypothetical protein n=1 Tax=Methylocystis sp. TaxID=1911079 RepID=UPI003DA315A6
MWQEQLDYFWDGGRRLAIGGFEGAERALPLAARPALTVVSARDPAFAAEPTLIEAVDAARWRSDIVLFDLPAEHSFLLLTAADGSTLTLALGAERDQPSGGEYRLLMTLLPEGNGAEPQFRIMSLPTRGDVERLAREQTATAGARLVWAIGQRRAFEQGPDGGLILRLAPARRMFPAWQSRLLLEARALETEAAADTREAPFAIMQHWVGENGAPRAALRLRIPDSLEESATLLGRTCVAMALGQRRRLRGWMQEQKAAGEPVIDPLGVEDIRQATGDPAEHPDAVEASDAVIVANLLNLLLDPAAPEADGVAVRRGVDRNGAGLGETIDIDFYGAALGDEVGLVCPAARTGDLGAAPVDPGGPPFARLFRIEADGLTPRRLDDDLLLDELMRRAEAASARMSTGVAARAFAERAAGLKGRREKLVSAFNEALTRAGLSGRFSAVGLWDLFEPLQQASFVALARDAAAPARIESMGGYGAYRVDPAVTAALAKGGPLAQTAPQGRIGAEGRGPAPLPARYAAACGAEGMAPPGLDAAAQLAVLRALMRDDDAPVLREARIGLSPDPALRREAERAARTLADAAAVERAIVHFEKHRDSRSVAALADYLAARRAGRWVSANSAPTLAALMQRAGVEAEAEQTRVAAGMTAAAAAPPPPVPPPVPAEKPKGFFRRLFGG